MLTSHGLRIDKVEMPICKCFSVSANAWISWSIDRKFSNWV